MRTGHHDKGVELMRHNLELIEKTKAKQIVFSCSGCFRAFRTDYQREMGNLGVELTHVSQLLAKYIKEGKLKFKSKDAVVTYHDPCHLGRHEGVYSEPRDVIASIPGVKFEEMDRITMNAWCCGAGGGVKSAFKDFALKTSEERIREAELTGASFLLSCCPTCKNNLRDGAESSKSNIKVMDLTEFLEELLE